MVLDGIPLSLENAPAGDYMVAVGVYDPQTMKRLSVIDSTGQPQPDNQMILPGDVIVGEGDGS